MAQNRKITVAFFIPSLEPGGTEKNVVNLINNLKQEHYTVSLVLGKKEGDFIKEVQKGIPVISLDAPHSPGLFFAMFRYFKKYQPDIFVSAFPRINIICLAAKLLSGTKTKIVITEHSVFSLLPVIAKTSWRRMVARFFVPALTRLLYPKADAIICVSQGIAKDLAGILPKGKEIRVIYNPVVEEKIYALAQSSVNHPWFLSPDLPIILAAGRLVPCKDYPTLLAAFSILVKINPARLVILGRGSEKERLEKLVQKLEIADSVAFLGFQENPYQYMKHSRVFVSSSLQEGFGNVIIEAMACGAPVVSTNCPTGPGEIIQNMENGILVPVSDENSLAKAMLEILNNPVLAEKLRDAGKKTAEYFSVQQSVREYEKVFEKIIS